MPRSPIRSTARMAARLLATVLGLAAPHAARAISCSASAGSLPFGTYDAVGRAQVNATVVISITCTGPGILNYVITLSAGQSGTATARYMSSGANQLKYQIYQDSARTQIFADGNGGTANASGTYLLLLAPSTFSNTLYGAVLANQNAAPGSYTDTLTMTVIY